jgi:putative addiction module component (TIGR02574 family)
MTVQPIIERFRKLSSSEKIRLLQELWDEVADEAARQPLSESHRRLLDERLREHDENPDDAVPWDKVRDDILSKL